MRSYYLHPVAVAVPPGDRSLAARFNWRLAVLLTFDLALWALVAALLL